MKTKCYVRETQLTVTRVEFFETWKDLSATELQDIFDDEGRSYTCGAFRAIESMSRSPVVVTEPIREATAREYDLISGKDVTWFKQSGEVR